MQTDIKFLVLLLVLIVALSVLYLAARLARAPRPTKQPAPPEPQYIAEQDRLRQQASIRRTVMRTSANFYTVGPAKESPRQPGVVTDGCSTRFPPGYDGHGVPHTLSEADAVSCGLLPKE